MLTDYVNLGQVPFILLYNSACMEPSSIKLFMLLLEKDFIKTHAKRIKLLNMKLNCASLLFFSYNLCIPVQQVINIFNIQQSGVCIPKLWVYIPTSITITICVIATFLSKELTKCISCF